MAYRAQACGRQRQDGLWEGWIEFKNSETGQTRPSARETTQPNLNDLWYWATGLTRVYLEGSLAKTLTPVRKVVDEPIGTARSAPRAAILDPFSVYQKRPDLLAQELTALRGWHLRQIIRDYQLVRKSDTDLSSLTESELASLIVRRVAAREVLLSGSRR